MSAMERNVMRQFPAKYAGDCVDCGGPITVGQLITGTPGVAYAHATCPDDPDVDLTLTIPAGHTLCPRCFCYHAGEC